MNTVYIFNVARCYTPFRTKANVSGSSELLFYLSEYWLACAPCSNVWTILGYCFPHLVTFSLLFVVCVMRCRHARYVDNGVFFCMQNVFRLRILTCTCFVVCRLCEPDARKLATTFSRLINALRISSALVGWCLGNNQIK